MIWIWVVALLATLVGLAVAWRALARTDGALTATRLADPTADLAGAARSVVDEVERTAEVRHALHVRVEDLSS